MRRSPIPLFIPLLALTLLGAAAATAAAARGCVQDARADRADPQADSPNRMVGFHRVPRGLIEGGAFHGARVDTVDAMLRWASVTAEGDAFLWRACADLRVRHVEPNTVVRLDA